ncbi:hypothetical protein BK133_00955 [Paenibacillus sp. FSL H8-0548]|uniref:DUF5406 family protein n=1 Tax=Paenibacillus sp. FSL H8-0548 TaxID=1920422 RepID=UPI00096EB149|nr:DUF5406 family protein [Paenibacillus sp. FSL H8-0548]OMF38803.1 hypothetical protein BK133_00955 [Paenibacillus sp. FSL H8-0548]
MNSYMGAGSYPKRGLHTVEVSLQNGEYKGTVIYEIGGNCSGSSILSSTLDALCDDGFEPNMGYDENKLGCRLDGTGYVAEYILQGPDGEMWIDSVDIEEKIVGVKILSFTEDEK